MILGILNIQQPMKGTKLPALSVSAILTSVKESEWGSFGKYLSLDYEENLDW